MAPDLDLIVGYADDYIAWAEQENNNSARISWFDRACHMFSTAAKHMRHSLKNESDIDRSDLVNLICDKAALLTEKGDFESAKQDLLQAVQLDPYNPDTRADLGFVNIELGNHKKARKNLEMAAGLEGWEDLPEKKKAYVLANLAHLAFNYGGPKEVLGLVNRSEEYEVDDPIIISSRAHALNKISMYREAIHRLDDAIDSCLENSVSPSDIASMYHVRSVSSFNLEGPDKAVEDLRTALKYDNENAAVRGDLGLLLFSMQHYESAGEELKLCIEQEREESSEETPELYARLSEALHLQGRYAEARNVLIDAKKQDVGARIEGINYMLGELELELGNARKAAEYIAEDIGREDYKHITDREASAFIVMMARVQTTSGNTGFALECYNRAYELDRENAAILLERGIAHSGMQDYENAERDLNAALELDRETIYRSIGEANYHFELGIAKAFQGKTAEGEKEISYALSFKGESAIDEDFLPKVYGELGYIQLENENVFGAQESFEHSLEYEPSIRSYAGWANARYLQGDQVDAEKGFRQALDIFEDQEVRTMQDWIDAIEIETAYNELSCREEYPVREQAAYMGIIVQDNTKEIMPEKRMPEKRTLH